MTSPTLTATVLWKRSSAKNPDTGKQDKALEAALPGGITLRVVKGKGRYHWSVRGTRNKVLAQGSELKVADAKAAAVSSLHYEIG